MTRAAAPSGLDLVVRPQRVEAALWRRFRFEDDASSREALFNRYAHLARTIAARLHRRRPAGRLERADFEQFAYEGLLEAIERYDPLLCVPFSAFARRRIAGSVADGVSRLSEVDAQLSYRRRAEAERLRSIRPPQGEGSEDALSALSDLALGLALGIMLEGTRLIDRGDTPDPGPTAYETLEWRQLQGRLVAAVATLPEKEALIVRQHYDNGLSFAQIAELLGLSRGRISQLHRSAIERLRKRIGA